MTEQVGASSINDLDNEMSDQIIDDLDNMIREAETESVVDEVQISTPKKNSSFFTKKTLTNCMYSLLIFVLIIVVCNKYTIQALFRIPGLSRYQDNALLPVLFMAVTISIVYFTVKSFM